MSEHEFTLVIEGVLADEEIVHALFEMGCDDATFGVRNGIGYGDFLREDPSFAAAVMSAVHEVESTASLRVRRVEPDDIVTMAEIAERLDRTRESVRLLIESRRGPGGFSPPLSHGRERGRLWRWSDVAAWLRTSFPRSTQRLNFATAKDR